MLSYTSRYGYSWRKFILALSISFRSPLVRTITFISYIFKFTVWGSGSVGLCFVRQTHPPQFSLLSGLYSSDQDFAYRFLQIPPHDGHPCGSASGSRGLAYSGLSPPSYRPCRAHLNHHLLKQVGWICRLSSLKLA
jgi:hypothetical protein